MWNKVSVVLFLRHAYKMLVFPLKKIAIHFKSATFGDTNWFSLLGEGSTAEVRKKKKKVKTNVINFTIVTFWRRAFLILLPT